MTMNKHLNPSDRATGLRSLSPQQGGQLRNAILRSPPCYLLPAIVQATFPTLDVTGAYVYLRNHFIEAGRKAFGEKQ